MPTVSINGQQRVFCWGEDPDDDPSRVEPTVHVASTETMQEARAVAAEMLKSGDKVGGGEEKFPDFRQREEALLQNGRWFAIEQSLCQNSELGLKVTTADRLLSPSQQRLQKAQNQIQGRMPRRNQELASFLQEAEEEQLPLVFELSDSPVLKPKLALDSWLELINGQSDFGYTAVSKAKLPQLIMRKARHKNEYNAKPWSKDSINSMTEILKNLDSSGAPLIIKIAYLLSCKEGRFLGPEELKKLYCKDGSQRDLLPSQLKIYIEPIGNFEYPVRAKSLLSVLAKIEIPTIRKIPVSFSEAGATLLDRKRMSAGEK